jgi:hypothetical protein
MEKRRRRRNLKVISYRVLGEEPANYLLHLLISNLKRILSLEDFVVFENVRKLYSNVSCVIYVHPNRKDYSLTRSQLVGRRKLVEMKLPPQIKIITEINFSHCINLTKIILEGVEILEDGSFLGCVSLKYVHLPNLIEIKGCAFMYCEKLEKIYIPDSTTKIGERAFRGCLKLKQIRISKNVDTINPETFLGCTLLEDFCFDNIKTIEHDSFKYCFEIEKKYPHFNPNIYGNVYEGWAIPEPIEY